jgi:hypothetical protein
MLPRGPQVSARLNTNSNAVAADGRPSQICCCVVIRLSGIGEEFKRGRTAQLDLMHLRGGKPCQST